MIIFSCNKKRALEAIGLNGVHAQITQNDHICQPLQSLSCQILLNHRASTDHIAQTGLQTRKSNVTTFTV